jgi:ATP-dependent Clp protease ATP-binding subunit ClpA
MNILFEHFSDRSKMIIFLARKDAGRRGATALETGDLLEAIINEDQGELANRFAGAITPSGPIRPPEPFFSEPVAAKTILRLHSILAQHEPVADSLDLPPSRSLQHVLNAARTLAQELGQSQVQPLHLVAAILGEEGSGYAEILRALGVSREAVIQALRS